MNEPYGSSVGVCVKKKIKVVAQSNSYSKRLHPYTFLKNMFETLLYRMQAA